VNECKSVRLSNVAQICNVSFCKGIRQYIKKRKKEHFYSARAPLRPAKKNLIALHE
jgi:hypothetical protein